MTIAGPARTRVKTPRIAVLVAAVLEPETQRLAGYQLQQAGGHARGAETDRRDIGVEQVLEHDALPKALLGARQFCTAPGAMRTNFLTKG
jgi:hypothetical protein